MYYEFFINFHCLTHWQHLAYSYSTYFLLLIIYFFQSQISFNQGTKNLIKIKENLWKKYHCYYYFVVTIKSSIYFCNLHLKIFLCSQNWDENIGIWIGRFAATIDGNVHYPNNGKKFPFKFIILLSVQYRKEEY